MSRTWLLILGELVCYGRYGLKTADPRLIALGIIGTITSILMLARTGHSRLNPPRPEGGAATLG
jgi:hypothetical protein